MSKPIAVDLPDASLVYWPAFFNRDAAGDLQHQLISILSWQQASIRLFGRDVLEPRLTAWYADPNIVYSYSGRDLLPRVWPDCLRKIQQQLTRHVPHQWNAVLGNLYRDGDDYMGWHSDNESSLGKEPMIASVSLGAEREFILRRKDNHRQQYRLSLSDGSLLLMQGSTQQFWQHSLPRRKKVKQARINLTFRQIIN